MRVHVWNAFASNNSGSYTIVGVLPSVEVAADVASKLTSLVEAHSAWLERRKDNDAKASPLAEFCLDHGMNAPAEFDDEWPEYGRDNRPEVTQVGTQVIVHHHYTVTLPPTFGEYFYKRWGRVEHEENHAHRPILTLAEFYWGWTDEERARMSTELPALISGLQVSDEAVVGSPVHCWAPAWRTSTDRMEPPLTLGAAFEDLIQGVSALRATAERHGAKMRIRLFEAPHESHDPFAFLRS